MALFGPSSYTVHLPSSGRDDAVFVADRFSLIAFLMPPLYFLLQRRWILALLALAVMALINLGLATFRLEGPAIVGINALVALFFALEAPSIVRWGLARSGYQEVAVMVAGSPIEAERRFFDESAAIPPPQPVALRTAEQPQKALPIIGLFPQAEPKLPR